MPRNLETNESSRGIGHFAARFSSRYFTGREKEKVQRGRPRMQPPSSLSSVSEITESQEQELRRRLLPVLERHHPREPLLRPTQAPLHGGGGDA
jgi:hypothetical protein